MKKTTVILMLMFAYGTLIGGGDQGADPNTYVLVISGINKDTDQSESKHDSVLKLQSYFVEHAKIASDRLIVLEESNEEDAIPTCENVQLAFKNLSQTIKPTDRFVLYYVGQANVAAGKLRLNLPGKDITHEDLSAWVNTVEASSSLLIMDCPCAGLAMKSLAGTGRIVVCGSRSDQPYSTHMSEYFIPALTDEGSDTDGDEKISLLEAFTLTARKLDEFYQEQNLLKTEILLLDDNGDGVPSQQPWRYAEDNNDGQRAGQYYFFDK